MRGQLRSLDGGGTRRAVAHECIEDRGGNQERVSRTRFKTDLAHAGKNFFAEVRQFKTRKLFGRDCDLGKISKVPETDNAESVFFQQRFAAIDGRAVGALIEESRRNAAELVGAAQAPAAQRGPAKAKKAAKASARRRR